MSDHAEVKLETHTVEIAIDGQPTYLVDIPTTQGREAAERRAIATIFHHDKIDLNRITVYHSGEGLTSE